MGFLKRFIEKFNSKSKDIAKKELTYSIYDLPHNEMLDLNKKDLDIDITLKIVNKDIQEFLNNSMAKKIKISHNITNSRYNRIFYGGGCTKYEVNSIAYKTSLKSQMEADLRIKEATLKIKEAALKAKIEENESQQTFTIPTNVLKNKINKLASAISIEPKIFLYVGNFIIAVLTGLLKNTSQILSKNELDASDNRYIVEDYKYIKRIRKFIRSLSRQISFQLNLTKKRLINLRQIFTKLHSFHFKNLDDYDSKALTSVLVG